MKKLYALKPYSAFGWCTAHKIECESSITGGCGNCNKCFPTVVMLEGAILPDVVEIYGAEYSVTEDKYDIDTFNKSLKINKREEE